MVHRQCGKSNVDAIDEANNEEHEENEIILEMDRPLDGLIKASNAPLRKALELIDK